MEKENFEFTNALTITIFRASDDDGFFYDIYNCEAGEVDDSESVDGGFCTSDDINDAYEMATSQANDLLGINKDEDEDSVCDVCKNINSATCISCKGSGYNN